VTGRWFSPSTSFPPPIKLTAEDVPDDISPYQTKKINGATVIPSLPPSKLDGCSFIDIEYLVKVHKTYLSIKQSDFMYK
jgi:hypothetical protein